MGKKKKKERAQASPAQRLARALLDGKKDESISGQVGLDSSEFEQAWQKSVELVKSPDPRLVLELPGPFRLAFLHVAALQKDEDLLQDLVSMAGDKELLKEARRIAHRLRSSGMKVEIPPASPGSILERKPRMDEPELENFLSPPDYDGNRFLWLARYTHGGVAVAQVVYNDTEGMVDFNGGVIGRNAYRRTVRELLDDKNLPLLAISYAEARKRLTQAAETTRSAGGALPQRYLEFSGELEPAEDVEIPSPRDAFSKPEGQELGKLVERCDELFELEEFKSWAPSEEQLSQFGKELDNIESSSVIINEAQRIEQIEKAIEKLVERQVEDGAAGRIADSLFEMASFLQKTDRQEQAKVCAAVAWSLLEPDLDAPNHPFLSKLVR
ncbi:MAG: hypothetical protein D6806_06435 [Deltaproteobacteria bacterium]|nr:MAG: hypothetical protein D6806_06435 [Deltaproteobacteria bacterium]